MKKLLILLVFIFLLVGCDSTKQNEEKVYNLDTVKVGECLKSFTYFSDTSSLNDEDLIIGYGIDTKLLSEYAVYISSVVEDPSMYIVAKPIEGKESVVKFQIKDMFDKYLGSYSGYYPEAVPMIENRLEKEYNGYLIYIISADNEAVYNKILECKK